jgi:nicotinamidase/pyrazinamidase
MAPLELRPSDALLVIDMQRDFLPPLDGVGGALAVAHGDQIVSGINTTAALFDHVLLTQDWHPRGHISFASTHGLQPFTDTVQAPYGTQHLWPDHCIQGTVGAELHPDLELPQAELILRKGFRRNIDSYSAFTENDGTTTTGLAAYLKARGLTRLFFCGLAYDYCVGFSALASVALGFKAIVLEDLTRGIASPSMASTSAAFAAAGVERISSTELASKTASKIATL